MSRARPLQNQLQAFAGPVESVVASRTNGPLLTAAAALWIGDDDRVVDVTYGRGNFWTEFKPANLIAHDLATDGVDFRHLPELDSSADVVVFDPPYIAQGGRATSTRPDFLDRYGLVTCPKTVAESFDLIATGMTEGARVLRRGGRLFVKCMDYVSSGRLVLGRHHVVTTALGLGLEQVDEFVHYSGRGPQPAHGRQMHSRRAHSFLCVFRKVRPAALDAREEAERDVTRHRVPLSSERHPIARNQIEYCGRLLNGGKRMCVLPYGHDEGREATA